MFWWYYLIHSSCKSLKQNVYLEERFPETIFLNHRNERETKSLQAPDSEAFSLLSTLHLEILPQNFVSQKISETHLLDQFFDFWRNITETSNQPQSYFRLRVDNYSLVVFAK